MPRRIVETHLTHQSVTDYSPASALFPEFSTLYDLIAREVEGLTDKQLDWTSDDYDWAEWSIRNQVSHMASYLPLAHPEVGRSAIPNADHGVSDVQGIAASPNDRRMDDSKYYDLSVILEKLNEGIRLIKRVLDERNVRFLRAHTVQSTARSSGRSC